MAEPLAFRFKAGGKAPANAQHSHRSTTKTAHKPFKAKHLTKGALKERAKGKVESLEGERGSRKTAHQQIMSKLDRRNQAKQKRQANHADNVKANSVFAGKDGAPRIVAVIPLCEDIDSAAVAKQLADSVSAGEEVLESEVIGIDTPCYNIDVARFKQRIQLVTLPRRDLVQALDTCRLADFVLFVLSAEKEVDEIGESMLRCIESQGVSDVLTVVQGLEKVQPAKRRPGVEKSLRSFIQHFFASQTKVNSLDLTQECANIMRSLCTTTPKGIHWREERSWMLVEELAWPPGEDSTVSLTGVVRGKGLKADRLLQVGDWGDFQVDRITAAPLQESRRKPGRDRGSMETETSDAPLDTPTADQDDIADLAPEEAMMQDIGEAPISLAPSERKGVLLDDHHYFDDEDANAPAIPKKLPRGTSKYQSAWYLGDVSDSGSDIEDMDEPEHDPTAMSGAIPADGLEGFNTEMRDATVGEPSEYPQSEMFLDPSPEDEAEQLAAYRSQRKDEANEDLEFPDEIELNPNVLARERLARYRGLKSLRTSQWETEEDKPHEPQEWHRLLEIANYKAARNRITNEALVGGVTPGTRVVVHIRIGTHTIEELQSLPRPTGVFSLLRHEHKRTACNHSITLSSDYDGPLRSKEELIMQCGPRRLVLNPLFSQAGNTPNNVHKFDRYLHPGRSAIATFIGPLIWGSVPTLYFKRTTKAVDANGDSDSPETVSSPTMSLIATGTSLAPSTSRVIAKRVVLTGHPYKIHKKLVTVRYMFFNSEDVAWFKALQLWTKRGRSGFVKESLGTHGYFKATFDGKINPMDAVAVSLYKRVWPRSAREYRPGDEAGIVEGVQQEQEVLLGPGAEMEGVA